MARGVYVVYNRSYDNPVCGVFTNLKKLHKCLGNLMNDDFCPSYETLANKFKERRDYLCFREYFYADVDQDITFEVEYTELNYETIG